MKYLDNTVAAFKEVYSRPIYYSLSFIAAILMFSFNAAFRNYKLLVSDFSFSLLFKLIIGIFSSFSLAGLILLVIMSILSGVIFAFSVYLLKRQLSGVSASGSVFLALLAPACPSCALGTLSIFGLGGFMTILPFKGLELGFLAIGIIIIALINLSGKIVTKTCSIA
jgi:hypothetical protein